MFCTTPKNEVYMYHVPSKKLIRTFAGEICIKGVILYHALKYDLILLEVIIFKLLAYCSNFDFEYACADNEVGTSCVWSR